MLYDREKCIRDIHLRRPAWCRILVVCPAWEGLLPMRISSVCLYSDIDPCIDFHKHLRSQRKRKVPDFLRNQELFFCVNSRARTRDLLFVKRSGCPLNTLESSHFSCKSRHFLSISPIKFRPKSLMRSNTAKVSHG